MRILTIVNPEAGRASTAKAVIEAARAGGGEVVLTAGRFDCERIVRERAGGFDIIRVCGGDGTLGEAANGLYESGAAGTCVLEAVPTGSGNDFVKMLRPGETAVVDLLRFSCGGAAPRCAINILNTGFDCDAVIEMEKYRRRPFIVGPAAYVLGLTDALIRKRVMDTTVELTTHDGSTVTREGSFLLIVAANGAWYGGGFRAAPLARTDDGLIELVLVRNVTRRRFLSLVSGYKKGTYVGDDGVVKPEYADVLEYFRCVSVSLGSVRALCSDGDIFDGGRADISVAPRAIRIRRDDVGFAPQI
jgi:diacylglycerol kinase family enzyme